MEKRYQNQFQDLVDKIVFYNPGADVEFLRSALELAYSAHKGQSRLSGEPYVAHCLAVAQILTDLKLDYITIAAGFLHDVAEDTKVSLEEIQEKFGEEVVNLVNGLTKISELRLVDPEDRQAENFRKMLLSMSQDLRVILIKFADRLHNMRTLEHLPLLAQERIARETLEVYAPLAHRFGIYKLKSELEDLCLKVLDPEAYREIEKKVAQKKNEREAYLNKVLTPLKKELVRLNISAKLIGRVKHFYGIYNKMKRRGKSFEDIMDLYAVRIITQRVEDCYHALGIVHSLFTPVQEKFTDFIAVPKANMYQSLHTKVIGPESKILEVQIRTEDMDNRAEVGIAAHWRYKEGKAASEEIDAYAKWLRDVLDWQIEATSSTEFMENLKINLFQDEIFVFTPKGKLITLARNSTPIDMAFAIHSDIGLHTIGAKVNGKIVPLNSSLYSGDTVEIITSANQKPSLDWLKFVKTSRARNRIKRYFKEAQFEQSVKLGLEILERELEKLKMKNVPEDMEQIALSFGHSDVNSLYAAVGAGDIPVQNVIRKLIPAETEASFQSTFLSLIKRTLKKPSPSGVKVQGLDSMMFTYAKCCRPLPGDKITGFITTGKGITIHRTDCRNIENLLGDPERNIQVEWDVEREARFNARIRVIAEDRKRLLLEITEVIAQQDVNIAAIDMKLADSIVTGDLIVEVNNLPHLVKLIRTLRGIKGIVNVERLDQTGDEDLLVELAGTSANIK
jgi:GTP pyrophosphokinase